MKILRNLVCWFFGHKRPLNRRWVDYVNMMDGSPASGRWHLDCTRCNRNVGVEWEGKEFIVR